MQCDQCGNPIGENSTTCGACSTKIPTDGSGVEKHHPPIGQRPGATPSPDSRIDRAIGIGVCILGIVTSLSFMISKGFDCESSDPQIFVAGIPVLAISGFCLIGLLELGSTKKGRGSE